jgi:hypothetical protein
VAQVPISRPNVEALFEAEAALRAAAMGYSNCERAAVATASDMNKARLALRAAARTYVRIVREIEGD